MTNPVVDSNETPKTPAPGVTSPAPQQQQTQGDKPATKPAEQQK